MSALSDAALPRYVAAGYDSAATAAYMEATRTALAHNNTVLGPDVVRIEIFRKLLSQAVVNVTASAGGRGVAAAATVAAVLETAQAATLRQVVNADEGRGPLMDSYRAYIGYVQPAVVSCKCFFFHDDCY